MHNNNFNFLRLLGALLVIFSHSFYITGQDIFEPINLITRKQFEGSAFGLCIFFFISGFFVTKSGFNSSSILSFLKKRILRIYPALIIVVLLSVFIAGPALTTLSIKTYFLHADTWKYLTTISGFRIRMDLPGVFNEAAYHLHNFNVSLWTIALELCLYVSLACLLIILKNKKIFTVATLIIVLSIFVILALKTTEQYVISLNLTAVFYLGAFVASSELNKKQVLLSFFTVTTTYIILKTIKTPINPAFLLLPVLAFPIYLIGFFDKIKLRFNTDISYGLYIFAFPIGQIIYKILGYTSSSYTIFFLTILVTIPIALASWFLIEKPCIQLKHKKFGGYKNYLAKRIFL
ncbi:MAG: acyltransferase [Bacteroidota bacterium]